jgi:MATE family multidrug resistance protein
MLKRQPMPVAPTSTSFDRKGADGALSKPVLTEAHALLRLAAPIMLISLVSMGMTITDTAMVSALFGAEALAAVAVGSDLYSILFYLGAGVLGGVAPLYTAAVVKARVTDQVRLERMGWFTVALLSILFVPLIWWSPDWLRLAGLHPDLLDQGRGFTRTMALTIIPMLGVVLYRTILTAAEKPKVFLRVTLAMLPLNALLNLVFMLGWGPVPAYGPTGAGIATLLVALASLATLMWIAMKSRAPSEVRGADSQSNWQDFQAVLRTGIPIGVATLAEVGICLAATIYAATLSAAEVAAHTLALRTAGVIYAVPVALLHASVVRMARAQALNDLHLQKAVTLGSILLSVVAGVSLCVVLLMIAGPLAHLFFNGDAAGMAAAGIAATLLVVLALTELFVGPFSAASGLLRGRKDTRAPMIYTVISHWAIAAPIGIYLCEARGMGITGVWIGLAIGTVMSTLLVLRRLKAHVS